MENEIHKTKKILLLILLVILNVVIRIPLVPHELGLDSFYIHQLSDSITDQGEAKWIRHPVQFLGFGETPPAMPILISGFSQCLGISSEISILLLSFIFGIFGAIATYIFIYYVTNDERVSYLAALLFSLSPEFLRLTIWTATTRSLFVALLPLFLYLLFRSTGTKRVNYGFLLLSIYVLLMATHHLGVMLLFYIFTLFILFLFKMFEKIKFIEAININIIIFMWFPLFLLLFLPVVLKLGFFKDYAFLWNNYLSGYFFEGDGLYVVPLNLIVDYVSKMGILLPFAITGAVGLVSLTRKRTIFENYVLIFLLLVAPILGVGIYTPMLVSVIFVFLVSIGLTRFMDFNVVRKRVKFILPVFLVVMLCFSMFMLVNWGNWTGENIGEKYNIYSKNTGVFIKNYGGNGTFTSNDRSHIYRYSVYSGVLNTPSNLYKYCFMERKKIKAKLNLDIMSIFKGHGENIILFEHEDNESLRDPWHEYGHIWASDPDGGRELLDKYNILYCVETNFGGHRYSEYYIKKMKLFEKMHESRPKIYDNEKEDIYFIG